eukprot:CAMPEP_0184439364 /NCGR_PEP_ID=MMETSP0738-20130409/706196_1 /TAXON_ID=385413 /ORGANISM="Thalassiosira miniscula, Strain CCMP1093" /LENGTH=73 /DNA_ID=CAMNT_0026806979 /DNA_START=10 /DNA_END=231 /DNA_ORIENTATION=-
MSGTPYLSGTRKISLTLRASYPSIMHVLNPCAVAAMVYVCANMPAFLYDQLSVCSMVGMGWMGLRAEVNVCFR